jgi:hypothetical protein
MSKCQCKSSLHTTHAPGACLNDAAKDEEKCDDCIKKDRKIFGEGPGIPGQVGPPARTPKDI